MNPHLQACIAYIAARLSGRPVKDTVHDRAQGQRLRISGEVGADGVQIYDHARHVRLSGPPNALFDHGSGAFVSLKLDGTRFSGRDQRSQTSYSGSIQGGTVTIFDQRSGQRFQYEV